ncbi:hypothetical protein [Stutzerimonas nitrititolerans]|uniref:hypothetical protein n=1 Tax=Stutzerimonas nitrititolerans TaxID=2482751 RepID=UPI0028A295EE|nr:hypothetical protein [Stutzerimonas nitrititolerans]
MFFAYCKKLTSRLGFARLCNAATGGEALTIFRYALRWWLDLHKPRRSACLHQNGPAGSRLPVFVAVGEATRHVEPGPPLRQRAE